MQIRLASSGSATQVHAGRVEIRYGGVWGSICSDGYDKADADVTCKMLGYSEAVAAVTTGGWGTRGVGPVWLSWLRCTGKENSLVQCQHGGWGANRCTHASVASVVCKPQFSIPG